MSSTGEWLATIDKRDNDEEFTEEVYLKIWHWESSKWVLSTRIDRPHASHAVTAIGFSPVQGEQGAILMTAGLDKQVKTWCLRSFDEKKGRNDGTKRSHSFLLAVLLTYYPGFWTARSSFSFQETIPVDARWSPDGSLLAVCFDRQVALYDPHTNSLLDCLVTPDAKHTSFINFIGRSGRHLLVSGRNNAALWDLVSRTGKSGYLSSFPPFNSSVIYPSFLAFAFFLGNHSGGGSSDGRHICCGCTTIRRRRDFTNIEGDASPTGVIGAFRDSISSFPISCHVLV